ncbi:hypothetical protein PC129_g14382 [Phytophthora cactorum]|uniref:Uncharacterized protein n=1 Tax=Phytophthora cactorum TaxID=29920 RepID=A0A8T1BAK3_9STRA|nr:hypothetical protein Pcac1_g25714 [Phytophthora cactorum]KAG2808423.1 hypothetical protein PC111_g16496 [Phytophthora cactorum]KAG2850694.1 hypothetical protein PC113_g16549 [Phytophthora cactorum]KAG2885385.1 hypothetical protein PC114_g19693 [Phytophthora cactorum]KAG2899721.1 hypothetical protein PC115_g16457 [Phytophthora cactorum]
MEAGDALQELHLVRTNKTYHVFPSGTISSSERGIRLF